MAASAPIDVSCGTVARSRRTSSAPPLSFARDGRLECELDLPRAEVSFEGPAEVVVRPESIAIGVHAEGGQRASAAKVVAREFFGHDQLVTVELDSGMRLRSRRLGFPAWHPGDRVRVWIDGPVTVFEAAQPDAPSEKLTAAR